MIRVGPLRKEEIPDFVRLVNTVFDEYVGGDYSEEGIRTFKEYTDPEALGARFAGESNFYAAKENGIITGALEIRNMNHIALFFVDKKHQGRGVGGQLFDFYLSRLAKPGKIADVTVNASLYAGKIYEALGFRKTGEVQEKNGIKYIPMKFEIR
ncbi:GNAT family N-acetyltransferase [Brucepastera parasyntrophica]|uniref:GNAT family N-acetyltransferase n=1 Tax=Brucepastera parasyntrophica TaxID=2880008 RepID=UPI00210A40B0|nr:GNAT family N-acetyltransferase [Brucepastera parasyntrophica]ULQ59458.1 GNAT family N-acetyltransferase [Brucepastera parasyntrophica]